MSSTELEHLIKMLNQIAENLANEEGEDSGAKDVAIHVKKFWAPSMIKTITQYAESDGGNLQATALAAVGLLGKQD